MRTSLKTGPFNFISFSRISGNLFFIILLIYSIVYAAERVTYVDSAWQFFYRVNNEGFFFPSDRYGVFISELPLYFAVKLHLSFSTLVYVFSVSYIVLYYLIWRVCTFTLKNPQAGLAIILCTFMGIRESFLHPVTETQQCMIFSCLLWALINYDFKRELVKRILVCATVIFLLFIHPIALFSVGFVILIFMVEKKSFKDYLSWLALGIVLLMSLWRFLSPSDTYDAVQYAALKSSSPSNSFSDSHALQFLLMHFNHFYWLPELAGLIVAVWLILKKEWMKFAAVLFSVAAYFIIACITFRQGDASIMLERIFLPAFFMINLVLAGLMIKEVRLNKWVPMLLLVFFIVNGIRYINTGCLFYKKRLTYLDELVKKGIAQGNDVYSIDPDEKAKEKILGEWALGTETLIWSKFKYDKCISITLKNSICNPGAVKLTSMLCLPVAQLNPSYFKLSGKPYRELTEK